VVRCIRGGGGEGGEELKREKERKKKGLLVWQEIAEMRDRKVLLALQSWHPEKRAAQFFGVGATE
jgi:hypothetical protein